MKTFISIVSIIFYGLALYAQPQDPKAKLAGHSEGIITKSEILSVEKLIPTQPDIIILSFTLSYSKGDDIIELISKSDNLTLEMKDHIKQIQAGTEISFENIKAKQGDKILLLESVNLKLKD